MCCNFEIKRFRFESTQYEILGADDCPFYSFLGAHSTHKESCKLHGNFVSAKEGRPDLVEALSDEEFVEVLNLSIQGNVLVLQNVCLDSSHIAAVQQIRALRGGRVVLYHCTTTEDLNISGPVFAKYAHIISCDFEMVSVRRLRSKTEIFVENSSFDILNISKASFMKQNRIDSGSARRINMDHIEAWKTFSLTRFNLSEARISDSVFHQGIEFSRSIVSFYFHFSDNQCHEDASFLNLRPVGLTRIENCIFHELLEMDFAEDYDYFIEERFDVEPFRLNREGFGGLVLENSYIKNYASFSNRSFFGPMSFKNTIFYKSPKFHNCHFHEDVSFEGTQFVDRESEEASRSYRALRLQMENLRSRHLEAFFFKLEQSSLRHDDNIDSTFKFFSIMYQISSEYGYNIMRPVVVFIVVNVLFGVYYHISFMPITQFPEGVSITARLAMSQAVNPIGVVSDPGKFKESFNITFGIGDQFAALFHGILNFGLIASFLIALRRRFRIS